MPYRKIEDGTDDTDGNAMKPRGVSDGVEDDTEGQGKRPPGVESDDTEGNATRGKGVSDGVENDTDGNRMYSDAEMKQDVTPVGDTEGEDDTDGNIVRSGRSVPPAANPGKGIRPKI